MALQSPAEAQEIELIETSSPLRVAALTGRTASTPVSQYVFAAPAAAPPAEPTTRRSTVQAASRFIATQCTTPSARCHLVKRHSGTLAQATVVSLESSD
jgi:hypothetical protein